MSGLRSIGRTTSRDSANRVRPKVGWLLVALGSLVLGCQPGPSTEDAAHESNLPGSRALASPAASGAMAVNLARHGDAVTLTWLEPSVDASRHTLHLSELLLSGLETGWGPAEAIATRSDLVASWADIPGLGFTASGQRWASWPQQGEKGTHATNVVLAQQTAAQPGWAEIGILHDDTSATEHGFASFALRTDGGTQVFWLDGRAMATGGDMQLRTAVIHRDTGIEVPAAGQLLDPRVCECCSTDAAMASAGPIVVYRDRSDDEIRDISVVRAMGDGGWSDPVEVARDGWQIHGCPVNGPAIAAEGDRVAVAWFSAAEEQPSVKVALSDDGGAQFEAPRVVSQDMALGRVDVEIGHQGQAFVSWVEKSGADAQIRWRSVASGGLGPVQTLAQSSIQRTAGTPKMVRLGQNLVFAWLDLEDPPQLRTSLVPLSREATSMD